MPMVVFKTLIRPKPDGEKVLFDVPALITEKQWRSAVSNLRERGRGRGKQGKRIKALFRTRMLCPRCQKPMSVLKKKGSEEIYYYCRAHYCSWINDPCTYNRFVPGSWDDDIWEEVCAMLCSDAWLDQQLKSELPQTGDIEKLIKIEQLKIGHARGRLSKVQEGWEKGLYTPDEAQAKIGGHRTTITSAESAIKGLQDQMVCRDLGKFDVELLRQQLRTLRGSNLEKSSFEEKAELVAMLGIKVLPTEDLKSRKIFCRLNLNKEAEQSGFAKVTLGGAGCKNKEFLV